jgi:hypothetical protein
MPDYHINDKWILNRISDKSETFDNWLSNLIGSIEKSIENIDDKVFEELEKQKDGKSKKAVKKDITKAKNDIQNAKKELQNLGSLGKIIPKITSQFLNFMDDDKNENFLLESKKNSIDGLEPELNLDFITGKKKSLSSALLDVSKERGIDIKGILYLIEALPDLEAFLYSTSVKKYYRDHTEHALRVAVLGDFLLEQEFENGNLAGIISELTELDKNSITEKIWWITGIIHDLGYPLGKMSTAVNFSLFNQLLKCYPTLDLEFLPCEIGLSWKGKQEDYLRIIEDGLSKEARELIRKGAGYDIKKLAITKPKIFLRNQNGHKEFDFKGTYDLDHGVLSALCLLNGLGTPEQILKNDEYKGYILAAKAIALHNFKFSLTDFNFDQNPLAFFLVLIDELQEWGRPIPIQIRDTYFTTELKKVTLLDELELHMDEFSWFMHFRNEKAKKLMNFNFNLFSNDKEKSLLRLNTGSNFRTTALHLNDIKLAHSKKKKEQIISQKKIIV